MLSEHRRDVPLDDSLLLFHLHPGFLVLSHLMFSEMLNVLRVDQILDLSVLVVEFLEMVDFVFIFVVSVVAGAQLGVGQLFARTARVDPGTACDQARTGRFKDLEDVENDAVFGVGRCGL